MYTARQALEAALNASAAQLDRQTLINIVVEPGTDQYRVVLTLLAPSTQTTALRSIYFGAMRSRSFGRTIDG